MTQGSTKEVCGSTTNEALTRAAPAVFLCLWSSGFVFVRLGLKYAEPLTFLALRYAIVIAIMACFFVGSPNARRITRRQGLHVATVGLLLQGGYFSATYLSVKAGFTSGNVALVTSLQPLLVGLLAPALIGEKIGFSRWTGMILSLTGTTTVILSYPSGEGMTLLGLCYAAIALVSITASTLYEKHFGSDAHPVTANLIQYAVGFAVTAPLAGATEKLHVDWSMPLLASLAYLVVCNSIIAVYLLLAMIRRGKASRVSALFFLVPPMTALIGFLLLGETLPILAVPGIVLAGAGVYIAMRT